MLFLALSSAAMAEPPARPVTLVGDYGGAVGPALDGGASGGAYLGGRLVVWPWKAPFGVDLSAREGFAWDDQRTLGTIGADARWTSPHALYLRAGFAHHHETPLDVAEAHPIGAMAGAAPGIRHRSGVEAGVGFDLNIPDPVLKDRVGLGMDVGVSVFPDDQGPPVYLFVEQTWTIDVGKAR